MLFEDDKFLERMRKKLFEFFKAEGTSEFSKDHQSFLRDEYQKHPNEDYEKIRIFEENLKNNPNSINFLSRLAELYNITHQYKVAIKYSNKILKTGENIKLANNNLFYAYDMLEDYDNVLLVLKDYLKNFPLVRKPELQRFAFSTWAVEYYENKKMITPFILSILPFNRPSDAIDINFSTSFHFSRIGWSERNTEALRLIFKIHPQNIDILNALGYSYILKGKYSEAKESLDKALLLTKENFRTYLLLGSLYRKTSNYKEAEDIFLRIIRLKMESESDSVNVFEALKELGLLYFESGEYEHAIEQFSNVLKFFNLRQDIYFKIPSMVDVYHNLGKAHQALGSKRKTVKSYERALEIDPSSVEVLTSLCDFYFERKMYYQALKVNARCLSVDAKYEPALKLREELSRHQKKL